jgi:heme exporter protein D
VEGWFGAEDFFDGGMYREYIWEAIDLAVIVSLLSGGCFRVD